jgi:hypothetical protein
MYNNDLHILIDEIIQSRYQITQIKKSIELALSIKPALILAYLMVIIFGISPFVSPLLIFIMELISISVPALIFCLDKPQFG